MEEDMPIKLRESRISSITDFINWFLEYFIFFKWIYFKNRPRANFLLLRSAMVVSFFSIHYYYFFSSFDLLIMGIDIDPVIALTIFITIGYWNMSTSHHRKSVDLTNLYNQYLAELGKGHKNSAEMLLNSLAIQVLTVDFWAHRFFSEHFEEALKKAIAQSDNPNKWAALFEAGKMHSREARVLLQNQQRKLINGLSA
jgi:ABC-type multidrug transport system fused ATPase/permease subunit